MVIDFYVFLCFYWKFLVLFLKIVFLEVCDLFYSVVGDVCFEVGVVEKEEFVVIVVKMLFC